MQNKLKEKLNCALKEANDEKPVQTKEKDHVLYFQERMDKTILKPETIKISARLNVQLLR